MINKIAIIGGGNIGSVLLQECVSRKLARKVALVDVKEPEFAKGKCLDVAEGLPVIGSDVVVEGSKTYEVIQDANIVINTAGVPRTKNPDGTMMSREDLLNINLKITDFVAEGIRTFAPNAIVISIANPLDAIVYRLSQKLGFPKEHLIGMAGVLDSARYSYFIAQAANVSVENVYSMVLGGHGDTMVPIRSHCRVAGMPVEKWVSGEQLDIIEQRTRKAGGEVVSLIGSGSAFVSPAWSALEMAEAIIYDKQKIMPCCVKLEGQYGVEDVFVGVPVILGKNGLEQIVELDLTEEEKIAFEKSVNAVKNTMAEVDKS